MTYLGMPLECAAVSFGWGNLVSFVHHLPPESAVYRAKYPEVSEFASRLKQSAILADIFDAITMFGYAFSKAYGGKGAKPEPYPRPWTVGGDAQKIGSEPIPMSEFNSWYYGGE